ncbi:hypothetical protein M514_26425, partial [Trichuris suis]
MIRHSETSSRHILESVDTKIGHIQHGPGFYHSHRFWPEDNWWYSYSEDATKYMYCKANEWKYVLVTCEKINGIQKIFNETHQVCLFPDDVPLASLKADAKNRQIFVGHVCEANIDCADGMHCTDGHCTCLDHHIQFNSLCYEESNLCPISNWVRGRADQPITCSLDNDCPPETFCHTEKQAEAPMVCCRKRENDICWPWAPYLINQKPVKCDQHLNTCLKGFTCELDNETGSSYCCMRRTKLTVEPVAVETLSPKARRIQVFHVCPVLHSPYLLDGYPLTCKPGSSRYCPAGYSCQPHESTGLYFCCLREAVRARSDHLDFHPVLIKESPSIVADGCPPQTTSVFGRSGKIITCDIFQANSCMPGSTCLYSDHYKRYQCCQPIKTASDSKADPCPFGEQRYHSLLTNQTLHCDPAKGETSGCPDGFFCLQSPVTRSEAYCCTSNQVCPHGKRPYTLPNTNVVPPCSGISNSHACPNGYFCYGSERASLCCPQTKKRSTHLEVISSPCVAGDPLVDRLKGNQFQKCSLSNPCPAEFKCVPTTEGSLCCPKRGFFSSPDECFWIEMMPSFPMSTLETLSSLSARRKLDNWLVVFHFTIRLLSVGGPRWDDSGRTTTAKLSTVKMGCQSARAQHDGIGLCIVAFAYGWGTENSSGVRIAPSSDVGCQSARAQHDEVVCSQKINPGIRCDEPVTFRYAFDVTLGSCQPYSYQGCSGNANNFPTIAQCENFCLQGLCFKGLPVQRRGRIVRCDLFERTCPLEHYCVVPVYGPATSRICCPSASEKTTGQPLTCRLEVDRCPENYYCRLSEATGIGICCSNVHRSLRKVSRSNTEMTDAKILMSKKYNSGEMHKTAMPSHNPTEAGLNSSRHLSSQLQLFCDTTSKRQYGQSCCSDEQCLYKCQHYRGESICGCPRHLLLDLTMESPRCAQKNASPSLQAIYTVHRFLMRVVVWVPSSGYSHLAESRLADRSGHLADSRLADRSYGRLVVGPTGHLADSFYLNYIYFISEVVCSQKINPGIRCDEPVTFRYAFDVTLGSCQPYSYQGCSGNANNFPTIAQCENFCLQGLCFKGLPVQRRGRIVRCDLFERTCPLEHYCVVPVYGPATSRICCPSASVVCALNKAEGTFCNSNQTSGSVSRFYFDFHTRSCVEFQFRGCGENGNNFETSEECLKFCSGFIAVPYSNDYGKQYSPGNAGLHVSVPACSVADHQLAPGSMYYRCDPKLPSNCPDGYSCQRSFNNHEYICCGFPSVTEISATKRSVCSSRSSGFSKLENYEPSRCASKLDCPPGLTCQYILPLGQHFCCPPVLPKSSDYSITSFGILNDCPVGELYLYPQTGQPLTCRLEVDRCPENYYCRLSEATGIGICCSNVHRSLRKVSRSNTEMTDAKILMSKKYNSGEMHKTAMPSHNPTEAGLNSSRHLSSQLQLFCDTTSKRQYGQSCCSDEQCLYKCQHYRGESICGCPRHLLLDLTMESPRC